MVIVIKWHLYYFFHFTNGLSKVYIWADETADRECLNKDRSATWGDHLSWQTTISH